MEKSAAYLAGFQAGFGEKLDMEKVAQLVELLEFEPENSQQAYEFLQKNAGFLKSFLANRAGILKKLLGRGAKKVPAAKPLARPASAGLTVHYGGGQPRTVDLPGVRGTTKVERGKGERTAKGPKFGPKFGA